jgi:hypothetical protein
MARYLLPGEAAARLSITASGIRWLADTRKLRSTRTPTGRRLIDARDVERLLRERAARTASGRTTQAEKVEGSSAAAAGGEDEDSDHTGGGQEPKLPRPATAAKPRSLTPRRNLP